MQASSRSREGRRAQPSIRRERLPPSRPASLRPQPRTWLGVVIIVLAALALAVGVMLAKLVYREGVSPETLVMSRAGGFAVLLLALLTLSGRPVVLPPRERRHSLLLGLVFALQSYCIFNAIDLIPVSLAALTEYTFPLQTALFMWLVRGERLGMGGVACFVAAFAGLVLVLDVSGNDAMRALDPRGVALALAASVLITVMMIFGNAIMGTVDSRRVTLHTSATVAVSYALVFALSPLQAEWPQSSLGWWLLGGSALTYLGGILGLFTGLAMVGPTRASMLANTEPVLTVSLAGPVLGEWLAPGQWLGAVLVLGAVFAMQLVSGRAQRGDGEGARG